MKKNYVVVEQPDALVEICRELRRSNWLAVDTEFEREKTYYPELCLLQAANEHTVAVIDPLALEDLQVLRELLYDPSITKVFHSARQDLEIFYHLWDALPTPLFDTQVAAPLLGYDEQMGYANLVSKVLGVELGKTQTRTRWKRRPLDEAQLQYAADDVIYLGRLYTRMRSQLEHKNRLGWLEAEFSALAGEDLYQFDADDVWRKNRGAAKLRGDKLCALQLLSAWREHRARNENRPRNWVLRDDTLVELARMQPASLSDLERVRGLQGRAIKSYGAEILKTLSEAKLREPIPQAQREKRRPLETAEEAKVAALALLARIIAGENDLHPNSLAPARELEKFVRNDPRSLLLEGWRARLIGEVFSDFLDGRISIRIINGKLQYRDS